MDSDEDTFDFRRQKKNNYRAVIDSDTDSNTSTESSNESSPAIKSKNVKKVNKNVLDSDSDSEEDRNTEQSSDGSGSEVTNDSTVTGSADATNANESTIDRSMGRHENANIAVQMANMSIRKTAISDDSVVSESEDEDEIAASFAQPQLSRSDSDTDTELEEQRQCFSPRTRRSITGIRPKDLLTSDDESDDEDEIPVSPIHQNNASARASGEDIYNKKRGRQLMQSFAINDSIARTPEPKRPNSQNCNSIGAASSSDISIKSDPTMLNDTNSSTADDSQKLYSHIEKSTSSVILIDSSDDEMNIITTNASTPHLVQPKISGAIRKMSLNGKATGVSQEYYNSNVEKLGKLQMDLKQNRELLTRLEKILPDKGANLKVRIAGLEAAVREQQNLVQNLFVQEKLPTPPPAGGASVQKISTWSDIVNGANAVLATANSSDSLEQRNAILKNLKNAYEQMETCPKADTSAPTPSGLNVTLLPHQEYGLAWALWREQHKYPCGGILADDMGLGKTISMIALMLASIETDNEKRGEASSEDDDVDDDVKTTNKWVNKGRRSDYYGGGTLVVCPATLIGQWKKEVENRVKRNYCTVYTHHGNTRESNARLLSKHTIVITTYGVVASEDKNGGPLYKTRWNRIVLDEAHTIRNHTTAMAKSCCALKGKKRWCLTGTPIQNQEMDLFSLWKFLKVPIFDNQSKFKIWMNVKTADGLNRLNARLRPMLLRRTKNELQAKGELQTLPEKHIETVSIAMTTEESNVYSKILTLSQALFAQFISQRAVMTEMRNVAPSKNKIFHKMHAKFKRMQGDAEDVKSSQILVLLTRLRQICDHPGLIDAMLHDEDVMGSDSGDEELPELDLLAQINNLSINDNENNNSNDNGSHEEISRAASKVLLRSNPVFDLNKQSSKCRKTLEIVQKILSNGDDKIVVVSQWTSVLNIVANFLNRNKINFVELTGKTKIKLRNDIVVNFNNSSKPQRVLLLSLVAGGVGLNLTGANHMILMDPHWNPQLEAQASDRVYRFGQTKPVRIYKLLCAETVEAGIQLIQQRKLNLSENVLTGTQTGAASKLSFQDLCHLFQM